jgi:hypothetical protein
MLTHGGSVSTWSGDRQSLCEKSLGSVIGRRNRLPNHDKASSYRTVGQAVSPVERLFSFLVQFEGCLVVLLQGRILILFRQITVADAKYFDFGSHEAAEGVFG